VGDENGTIKIAAVQEVFRGLMTRSTSGAAIGPTH